MEGPRAGPQLASSAGLRGHWAGNTPSGSAVDSGEVVQAAKARNGSRRMAENFMKFRMDEAQG